jgi:hypothetical protein
MSDGLIDYISLMRHICRSPQQGDLHRLEPGVDSYSYATLKGLNCIPGRTVIVSPETNTHHSLPDDLWIILIKVLLYRNFSVLLNISSNNHNKIREHFLHTESVAVWQLPSHLPVRITEAAGFFIGMNCGLTGIQSIWCKNTFGIVINNLTIKSNGKPVDKGGNVWKKENLSFFKLMPKLNFYGLSEFFIESSDDFRLLVNELLAW